ncbi:MAG: LPS export ABC transporter permease LptF [Parvibaculum sp.]|nr:LPS export ABC transporter permease LptF [Parvibaculum sp.]
MFPVLTRYIFLQAAVPLALSTFVLTGIIWLTQALRMLDLLITQGQTLGTFFQLSVLALPTAVNTVLPIALFCALLYTLNKLISDSELVVIFSAGISRWSVAYPVMLLVSITMIIVLFLNIYLMPAGMRELRYRLFQIRGDIATSMIREGAFTNPVSGLTVYVRSRTPNGSIKGILVHDERVPGKAITYMAESGEMVRTEDGPRLVMYNGNIERVSETQGPKQSPVSILYFAKYTYDLSQYNTASTVTEYEARERFLPDLFNPASNDFYGQQFKNKLRAEGHDRLVAALYPAMFALIALACLLPAPFNRRGYTLRIATGAVAAILARLVGFSLYNLSTAQPSMIPFVYLLPVGVSLICCAMIGGMTFDSVKRRVLSLVSAAPQARGIGR